MSQPNIPQAPERLPNEPYYQQPQADQRRRWGRILVTIGLVWLAVTLVGSGPWFAGLPFAPARTVDRDLPGSSLLVVTQSDDIVLERSADGEFHIQATVRGWGWGGSPEDVLRRAGIEISGENGQVHVNVPRRGFQLGNFGVELRVAVPQRAPVKIETASGDVTATALAGSLAVTTTSGDVRLNELTGGLIVHTTSGDVQLRDGRPSGVAVDTTSGDVDLRGVTGSVAIHTQSGDIGVREADDATLELQSTSGDMHFEGVLAPTGNNGVKTVSGDLNLRVGNPALNVSHTTISGDVDIEVEARSGAQPTLQLTTTSGDMQVKPLD